MSKPSKNPPAHRDFYVYEHRRKSDGRTFYVGKGRGRRAWDFHHRHAYWKRIAGKNGVDVVLLYEGLTEQSSLDLEKQIISAYGRDVLCNLTDGGEGTAGFRWDDDQRDGMRSAARLRWKCPEYRRKFTASRSGELSANYGRTFGPDVRRKISESVSGEKNGFYGRTHDEKTRAKMSAAKMGKKCPNYDHEMRTFTHSEHGIFIGTQHELRNQYGLSRDGMSHMIRGRTLSHRGWSIVS